MDREFSNTSILTLLSLSPEEMYSITYLSLPAILKHTGSLDSNLKPMELAVNTSNAAIRSACMCGIAIYYLKQ